MGVVKKNNLEKHLDLVEKFSFNFKLLDI